MRLAGSAADSPPRLVHETRRRLRFRLARLGDPLIDFAWLEAWLESVRGVESVRINHHARSVIFEYDGSADARGAILERLDGLPRQRIPAGEAEPGETAELAPVIGSLAVLFLLPFLSPPVRACSPWSTSATPCSAGSTP
jgi:manganese/zinc-transporting P-type ATPase C